MATQSFDLPVARYSHVYNWRTNDVINYPSFLMLPIFVICGHISYQQDSSQRVTLDLSNYRGMLRYIKVY